MVKIDLKWKLSFNWNPILMSDFESDQKKVFEFGQLGIRIVDNLIPEPKWPKLTIAELTIR